MSWTTSSSAPPAQTGSTSTSQPLPPTTTLPSDVTMSTNAPREILDLPRGTIMEARVLDSSGRGTMTVDTPAGPMPLRSTVPLAEGTSLTLQLTRATGTTAHLRFTSVDGKPWAEGVQDALSQNRPVTLPAQGLSGSSASGGAATQPAVSAPVGTSNAISVGPNGSVVQATVLHSSSGPVDPGTILSVRLAGVSITPSAAQAGTVPLPPSSATSVTVAVPQTDIASAGGATSVPSSTSLSGTITSSTVPTGTNASGPTTPSPSTPQSTATDTSAGQAASSSRSSPSVSARSGQPRAPGSGPTAPPPPTLGAKVTTSMTIPNPGQATQTQTSPAPAQTGNAMQQSATAATTPQGGGSSAATGQGSTANLVGQSLTGTVSGNSAAGATMVHSSAGLLALSGRMDLPSGARLTLDVLGQTAPQTATPAPSGPALSSPLLSATGQANTNAWPAMSDTLALLKQTDPQAARQLAMMLPSADARLVANMIVYAQAMRAEDPQRWLPQSTIQALENAGEKGSQLLQRLQNDLRDLQGRSKQPASSTGTSNSGTTGSARSGSGSGGDWRIMSMPFMDGGAISQINVITRRLGADNDEVEDQGRKGQKGVQGHRFLINLSLTRLGDLQFDGLYKSKDRSFELIIRSRAELAPTLRQDVKGLFARSSEALKLTGGIQFRVTDHFVGPPPVPPVVSTDTGAPDETTAAPRGIGPAIPDGGWTA